MFFKFLEGLVQHLPCMVVVKMRVSVGRTFAAAFKEDICRRGDNRGTWLGSHFCVSVRIGWFLGQTWASTSWELRYYFWLQLLCQVCERPVCLVRRHCLLPARLFFSWFPNQLVSRVTLVRPTHLWQCLKGRRSLVVSGCMWSLFILRMFQDSVLGSWKLWELWWVRYYKIVWISPLQGLLQQESGGH